eukprot:PhM_4_TR3594/c0_g1_i1/m.56321
MYIPLLLWPLHHPDPGGVITALQSIDGRHIAALHSSGTVSIWTVNPNTNEINIKCFVCHTTESNKMTVSTSSGSMPSSENDSRPASPSSYPKRNSDDAAMANWELMTECVPPQAPKNTRGGLALVSGDGTLSVVNLNDGLCVASAPKLAPQPTSLVRIECAEAHHVAVATMNSQVYLFDTATMTAVHVITTNATSMISSVACSSALMTSAVSTTLVAACADRKMLSWKLNFEPLEYVSLYKFTTCEEKIVDLALPSPLSCVMSEGLPLLLVVFPERWILLIPGTQTPVHVSERFEDDMLIGGFWLDDSSVCLEQHCGDLTICRLPSSVITAAYDSLEHDKNSHHRVHESSPHTVEIMQSAFAAESKSGELSPRSCSRLRAPITTGTGTPNGDGNKAHQSGVRWVSLRGFVHRMVAATYSNGVSVFVEVQGTWRNASDDMNMKVTPFTLPGNLGASGVGDATVDVTVSLLDVSSDCPRFIEGDDHGNVVVTRVGGLVQGSWQAHASGITALNVLFGVDKEGLVMEPCLATGCASGQVRIWHLSHDCVFSRIATLSHHSAPVTHIVLVPEELQRRLGLHYATISEEDGSIALYNLSHETAMTMETWSASPLCGLFWDGGRDVCGLLGKDGTVTVWSVAGATVERVLRGNAAFAFGHRNVNSLGTAKSVQASRLPPRSAFRFCSTFTTSLHKTCQGILIDVKRLLHYIQKLTNNNEKNSPFLSSFFTYLLHSEDRKLLRPLLEAFDANADAEQLRPYSTFSCYEHGVLTCYSPEYNETLKPYSISRYVSGTRMLSLVALLSASIRIDPERCSCKQAIRDALFHFGMTLPWLLDERPGFFLPSMQSTMRWLPDDNRDIQFAARCIARAIVRVSGEKELDAISQELEDASAAGDETVIAAASFVFQSTTSDNTTDASVAKCPNYTPSPKLTALAFRGLMSIVKRAVMDSHLRMSGLHATAISLLGDAFCTWAPMLHDVTGEFFSPLFDLAAQCDASPKSQALLRTLARTISIAATANVTPFLRFMDDRVGSNTSSSPSSLHHHHSHSQQSQADRDVISSRETGLGILQIAIKRNPVLYQPHVFRLVALVARMLDPHYPRLRDRCMETSSRFIKTLCTEFPTVAFCQDKQKLLAADHSGQVLIYDLNSATEWKSWMAHTGAIVSAAFSTLGDEVATFSPKASGELKIWRCENSSFGATCRCTATIPCPNALPAGLSLEAQMQFVKLFWVSPHAVELKSRNGASHTYQTKQ